MECGSEFQALASRNPFVRDLEEQGYLVDFIGGYFVIYGLPYLNDCLELAYGDWASPVDLSADGVLDSPKNHQAWFRGSRPHDQSGRQLRLGGGAEKVKVTEDFQTDYSFSFKLYDEKGQKRPYRSFEEKVSTYLDVITGPALAAFPDTTPFRGIEVKAAMQGTPLRYPDTLSSRYHMNDLSRLLEGKKVAIIGLGGTGSYILDFISRTHLAEIVLFDDDKVHVHTIFRFPGFIPGAIGSLKVDALSKQFSNWHANITPIPERVTDANIERLRGFNFVFLTIDHGPSRIFIADWLSKSGIPFLDCGMGLNRVPDGLNGVVRITGVDRTAFEATQGTVFLPGGDPDGGEYRRQGQIAELNALNAALAVVRFKQHFAIYDRLDDAASLILETSSFEFDRPQVVP
ncbi:thiamine biosynthesis protein ThiF [Hartmannibacter diazotrophicus]|uniref:Thiamine biosynthesis protein ThiF n=1 Tax=Hartmannibacter diazotrophicus TaxID=1482074 RepID=A0A2C9D1W3_9HYPH|nr:ThiF family adenylyltransferase [Hartmannibacter diazotrophicus]SON54236.1 thiamine biosynthesis protein ThiF [Hartmannibacter diazotrophicus]